MRILAENTDIHYASLRQACNRYLKLVAVDPAAQGRGVGRQLVVWGLGKADSASPPLPAYLEATRSGTPLYTQLGFTTVDTVVIPAKEEDGSPAEVTLPAMLRPVQQRTVPMNGLSSHSAANRSAATTKHAHPAVRLEPVQRSDLRRCAELFLDAYAENENSAYMRPARLRDDSKSREDRIAAQIGYVEQHLDKIGTSFLKAVDAETGQIHGAAVWARKPVYIDAPSDGGASADDVPQIDDREVDTELFDRLVRSMQEVREQHMHSGTPHWYVLPD